MAGTSTQEMRFNTITKQCAQYVDCSQLYITGTAATTIKAQAAAANTFNDGVTAGTVTASKAIVVDDNRDIATFGAITSDGKLSTS
jgi:hypothetical protein